MASVVLLVIALDGPSAEGRSHEFLQSHHSRLAGLSDADYVLDRARVLGGVVFGPGGGCDGAVVRIHDGRALSATLASAVTPEQALEAVRELREEQRLRCEPSGAFLWSPAELGPKWLWIEAAGHAPRRMGPYPVRDGLGVSELRCQLSVSRPREVMVDLPSVCRVTPIHAGWWPGEAASTVDPEIGAVIVEWRDPDGWPVALALHDLGGSVECRAWPEADDGGPLPPVSTWGPWQGSASAVGEAAVILDPRAVLFTSGRPDLLRSPGGLVNGGGPAASLVVSAPTGFGVVELRRRGEHPIQEFADAFGEYVVRDDAPERVVVRCLTPYRGWSSAQGALPVADRQPDLLYFHPQEGADGSANQVSLVGFVDEPAGVVAEALVFCQPATWPAGGPIQRTTTDEHGFYRFGKLTAGAAYDLVFVRDERPNCLRLRQRVVVGAPGAPPVWEDLRVPGTTVSLGLPPGNAAGEVRLIESLPGAAPRWTVLREELTAGTLLDVPPGTWSVEVWSDGERALVSQPVSVAADSGEVHVTW